MTEEKEIRVVNGIVIKKGSDEVLLIKRKKTERVHSGIWAFPGGKIEDGEDINQAIMREIKEEVGLDVNK